MKSFSSHLKLHTSHWPLVAQLLIFLLILAPLVSGAASADPFALIPVSVECLDKQGNPVVGARVYAYCKKRVLLVSQEKHLNAPAGVTDFAGRVTVDLMSGVWSFMAVGATEKGEPWVVTEINKIQNQGAHHVKLASDRDIALHWRGRSDRTTLNIFLRPEKWPKWWQPPFLTSLNKNRTVLETGKRPVFDVFAYTVGDTDADNYFIKTALKMYDRALIITTEPNGMAEVNVHKTPEYSDEKQPAFFVLESPDFVLNGHPVLFRMTTTDKKIYVSPGTYRFRYYVEWFTDDEKWHAEFANTGKRLKAHDAIDYSIEPVDRIDPYLMRHHPEELQFKVDAVDRAGNRLAWVAPPEGRKLGTLKLLDDGDREVLRLDLEQSTHNWRWSEGPRYDEASRYEFVFNMITDYESSGPLLTVDECMLKLDRTHLSVLFPESQSPASRRELVKKADRFADFADIFVTRLYQWYHLSAPTGIVYNIHPAPATAGGSAGRYVVMSIDYLLNGEYYSSQPWEIMAHELGHSMHCIPPMHVFLENDDNDRMGLFNESQATFLGDQGLAQFFGRDNYCSHVGLSALYLYRLKRGETEFIGDPKAQLHYVTSYLQNILGDDWVRRIFAMAHKAPPDWRNKIRAQDWTPAEKIAALFSIAARKDLSPYFNGAGLTVRAQVMEEASRL